LIGLGAQMVWRKTTDEDLVSFLNIRLKAGYCNK